MKKITVLLLLLLISKSVFGQLSSFNFDSEKKFKFSLRYAAINTLNVGEDSVRDVRGILLRYLEWDFINSGVGGINTSHRWSFLPETFALAVVDALNGGDFEWGSRNTSTYISDYILGWHNHSFNLVASNNFGIGGGLHWGDYYLAYQPYQPGIGDGWGNIREPAGWYGAVGPVIMIDYNLFNLAVLHIEGAYGFSFRFSAQPDMIEDKNYPAPRFFNLNAQIRSNSLFYGGLEHIRSFNRGYNPFDATRTDFFIGIWL